MFYGAGRSINALLIIFSSGCDFLFLWYFISNLFSNCSRHYYHFIQLIIVVSIHIFTDLFGQLFSVSSVLFVPSELKFLLSGVYPSVIFLVRFS